MEMKVTVILSEANGLRMTDFRGERSEGMAVPQRAQSLQRRTLSIFSVNSVASVLRFLSGLRLCCTANSWALKFRFALAGHPAGPPGDG